MIKHTSEQNETLKLKTKILLESLLSHNNETETLLHQKAAENNQLRLVLRLERGQEIPREEFAQLSAEREAELNRENEIDDAMLEEMIRAEEEGVDDVGKAEDSPESNDMFTQFLRENEIIEGDQNYCEDDTNFYEEEESTQGFGSVKRKNSF
eukprot:TRINITY_DN12092_c0_g4_i1.p1 TRINITY_DN12092_c0_g4~~TRINITY_DN12092_c0_g4_i1.p1  ORF type:complete len:153 (+),score=50.03 TRINITY_DN12092_c0_g4_i1:695-1153(+)